eukprot:7876131-Ditylum_brightwellii.AAC.2
MSGRNMLKTCCKRMRTTSNLADNFSDVGNRDSHEFDWLDVDDDMIVNNNNWDAEEVQIQWDGNHWSQLELEYD